jgi:hypothetical protein
MPKSLPHRLLALVSLAGLAGAVTAQPLRWGGEFQVSSGFAIEPDVAVDAAGGFVVVFDSTGGIFAQRFDRSANRLGEEFQVNTYTTGSIEDPAVALSAAGDIIVVWQSEDQGSHFGVYGQLFDAEGTRRGGEFRVNTVTSRHQFAPDVAAAPDGSFVVVWQGEDPQQRWDVLARRYDPSGIAMGGEFQVNTTESARYKRPAIASDPDGDFVVAWRSTQQGYPAVDAQRYDSSGNALGGEFQVNTSTSRTKSDISVATDAEGNFVVAWVSRDPRPSSDGDVLARRYDASGNSLGGEFQVNSELSGYGYSSVAMGSAGAFVIAWRGRVLGGGSSYEIGGRAYDATGTPVGGEFQVNANTTGSQSRPSIASDAEGNVVATWYVSGGAVWGQRFAGPGIHLAADGACAGPVTVSVLQAPPLSEVGIIAAANLGGFTKGGALCGGTELEIGEPFALPPRWVIVDENGAGSVMFELPAGRCYLEALALADCSTSGAVWVP